MPIEVRELVIRVSVNAQDAGGAAASGPASGGAGAGGAASAGSRQSLIADCVEQVLQVLRDQRER